MTYFIIIAAILLVLIFSARTGKFFHDVDVEAEIALQREQDEKETNRLRRLAQMNYPQQSEVSGLIFLHATYGKILSSVEFKKDEIESTQVEINNLIYWRELLSMEIGRLIRQNEIPTLDTKEGSGFKIIKSKQHQQLSGTAA